MWPWEHRSWGGPWLQEQNKLGAPWTGDHLSLPLGSSSENQLIEHAGHGEACKHSHRKHKSLAMHVSSRSRGCKLDQGRTWITESSSGGHTGTGETRRLCADGSDESRRGHKPSRECTRQEPAPQLPCDCVRMISKRVWTGLREVSEGPVGVCQAPRTALSFLQADLPPFRSGATGS